MRAGLLVRFASVLFVAMLAAWLPLVAANAQQDGPNYVGGTTPRNGTQVSGAATSHGNQSGRLPRTGASIAVLAAVGIAFIVGGRLLMIRRPAARSRGE